MSLGLKELKHLDNLFNTLFNTLFLGKTLQEIQALTSVASYDLIGI